VAILLFALVGVVLAVTWAFQRSLIYYPSRGPVPRADEVIDGARGVTLETSDGLRLGAWFVPARASATCGYGRRGRSAQGRCDCPMGCFVNPLSILRPRGALNRPGFGGGS